MEQVNDNSSLEHLSEHIKKIAELGILNTPILRSPDTSGLLIEVDSINPPMEIYIHGSSDRVTATQLDGNGRKVIVPADRAKAILAKLVESSLSN